jgi:hypothetical protein
VIIYYDSLQEGLWFQDLHPELAGSELRPFPPASGQTEPLRSVLAFDRPDIILVDGTRPILVVERTVEVPSGHNVSQRFARLVAAAQRGVPVVYFGPYAAYKHGGATQGPRYMNLRLFFALDELARIEKTAITIINWPIDTDFEVIQTPSIRDARMKEYMDLFFTLYKRHRLPGMLPQIMASSFERRQEEERQRFIATQVQKPEQYNVPPPSVVLGPTCVIAELARHNPTELSHEETVFYGVGMRYIRSDPYTGTALLYAYLYCGGLGTRSRNLVLHFPHITKEMWIKASRTNRKDTRLFKLAADGIVFADGYLPKSAL